MKRRDLLKQAVAFAALASVRASQAGAAETKQLAESLLGEKTARLGSNLACPRGNP